MGGVGLSEAHAGFLQAISGERQLSAFEGTISTLPGVSDDQAVRVSGWALLVMNLRAAMVSIRQTYAATQIRAAAPPIRGPEFFEDIALQGTKNPASDRLVLGKFFEDGKSYAKVAAHFKATYLKGDNWREVTKMLTDDEVWSINMAFLRQQIKQGKQIIFSHNPDAATGFFLREVEFLEDLGYSFVKDGWIWTATK